MNHKQYRMKKLLLSLLLALPLCGFAQKGMQGVGFSFGVGSGVPLDYGISALTSLSGNFNYQRNLGNKFRLVPSIGLFIAEYDWGESYSTANFFHLAADAHYFLTLPKRLRPYVIAGVLYETGDGGEIDEAGYNFGFKFGLGLDYRLGYHFAMQLEIPLNVTFLYPNFMPTLGLAYTF